MYNMGNIANILKKLYNKFKNNFLSKKKKLMTVGVILSSKRRK